MVFQGSGGVPWGLVVFQGPSGVPGVRWCCVASGGILWQLHLSLSREGQRVGGHCGSLSLMQQLEE